MSSMTGAGGMGATGDNIPKGYKKGSLQQFTPEQMQLFQSMFGQVGPQSFLSTLAGGSQEGFEQLEAPAMRQFQGLTGQLASRFSGAGMGGRRSSGFQNAFGQQASDFASDLASKRMALLKNDLTGKKIWDLEVLEDFQNSYSRPVENRKTIRKLKCKCKCGVIFFPFKTNVLRGLSKRCIYCGKNADLLGKKNWTFTSCYSIYA